MSPTQPAPTITTQRGNDDVVTTDQARSGLSTGGTVGVIFFIIVVVGVAIAVVIIVLLVYKQRRKSAVYEDGIGIYFRVYVCHYLVLW